MRLPNTISISLPDNVREFRALTQQYLSHKAATGCKPSTVAMYGDSLAAYERVIARTGAKFDTIQAVNEFWMQTLKTEPLSPTANMLYHVATFLRHQCKPDLDTLARTCSIIGQLGWQLHHTAKGLTGVRKSFNGVPGTYFTDVPYLVEALERSRSMPKFVFWAVDVLHSPALSQERIGEGSLSDGLCWGERYDPKDPANQALVAVPVGAGAIDAPGTLEYTDSGWNPYPCSQPVASVPLETAAEVAA